MVGPINRSLKWPLFIGTPNDRTPFPCLLPHYLHPIIRDPCEFHRWTAIEVESIKTYLEKMPSKKSARPFSPVTTIATNRSSPLQLLPLWQPVWTLERPCLRGYDFDCGHSVRSNASNQTFPEAELLLLGTGTKTSAVTHQTSDVVLSAKALLSALLTCFWRIPQAQRPKWIGQSFKLGDKLDRRGLV